MLSIGQFSKICLVSIKTLHYYDKIGLMAPQTIDDITGYRYYSEDQLPRMLLIQRLKRYGFSLAEIKQFLLCENQRALFSKLEQQKSSLQTHLQETALICEELERHILNFERTGNIMGYQDNYTIELRETKDLAILSSRQHMSVDDFGHYYEKLFKAVAENHLTPAGITMAIYHDEEFSPDCSDIELAIVIKENDQATRQLPGCLCAMTVHHGAYSSLPDSYGAIVKWISNNGYETTGCPYEIYRKNQFNGLPVDQWETDIYFPVKKL